jgi:uncharacterized protein YkwD
VRLFRGVPVPRVQGAVILGAAAVVMLSIMPAVPKGSLSESEPIGRYSFTRGERCFLRKINNMRQRNGRRRLDPDKQLGYVARRHARRMASNRSIYHDGGLGGKVTRWRRLGQNVGRGGGCKRLFKAFKNSSGHRANILGRWRFMGVGLDRRGGDIFVMHVFQARRNPGNIYHYP